MEKIKIEYVYNIYDNKGKKVANEVKDENVKPIISHLIDMDKTKGN